MTIRGINVFGSHTGLDTASSDFNRPILWIPAQHIAGMTGGKTEFTAGLRLPLIAYSFLGVS
jgi:hypothetical protein